MKIDIDTSEDWSYSRTRRLVQALLGIHARVWHDNGKNVRIGMAKGKERVVLFEGSSFADALESWLTAVRARAETKNPREEREARLASLGFEEPTEDQQRENLRHGLEPFLAEPGQD